MNLKFLLAPHRLHRILALLIGIFPISAVFGQSISCYVGDRNVSLSGLVHPFRGPEATLLYTSERDQTNIYAGLGYIIKSWLLGSKQNLYLSSGIQLAGADSDAMQIAALSWRNRARFEPRGWQRIQFAAEFDFSPDATTYKDGEQTRLWVVQIEFLASTHTSIAFGARQLRAWLENGEQLNITDGAALGLRYHF